MKSMAKKLKQNLRSSKKKEKERLFLDNGSMFLKELIADCNGKSIPIRRFSSDQIYKATKNFDFSSFVTEEGFYMWYKGRIEDRSYMIKKFAEDSVTEVKEVYNDIVLSARMSNHNNFLKLLGYCLEFPFPVLVFEYAEYGALKGNGIIMVNGEESILPWNIRLKIVKEIANALTYLHMAFPNIIIYRDVRPSHIFLDENWTAKVSDLDSAILIDEGKSQIEAQVLGTLGYLDPLYVDTRIVSEYTDVYSFGVFLLVVLTGRTALFLTETNGRRKYILEDVKELYENGKVDEVIDEMMMNDITSGQRLLLETCIVLALRCCEKKNEDRPKMMEIAKQLKRIERSFTDP